MATSSPPPVSILSLLDATTLLSLALVVLLILLAYTASLFLLTASTPKSLRVLFIWHAFDALIHFVFEGSFLYNCFFTYIDLPPPSLSASSPGSPASAIPVTWVGHPVSARAYGSNFASESNHFAALWRVYAAADARWGGADATVVALELLTVFVGGPLACWVCRGIARRDPRAGVWMVVLATGELYGGFMTFAPEWLTGNPSLDGSNFMYLWVYLFFFNMLWVVFPLYAIVVAYKDICNAFYIRNSVIAASIERAKKESGKAQ